MASRFPAAIYRTAFISMRPHQCHRRYLYFCSKTCSQPSHFREEDVSAISPSFSSGMESLTISGGGDAWERAPCGATIPVLRVPAYASTTPGQSGPGHRWSLSSWRRRQRKGGIEKRPVVSLLRSDVLHSPKTSSRVQWLYRSFLGTKKVGYIHCSLEKSHAKRCPCMLHCWPNDHRSSRSVDCFRAGDVSIFMFF